MKSTVVDESLSTITTEFYSREKLLIYFKRQQNEKSTQKPYMLLTDASHYAYSGVLTQAVESPEDLRPVTFTFTSGSFSEKQQRWSATEMKSYVVYQSMLKFDLYLRRPKCVLHCDHKPLKPFLPKGVKIPKVNRWSMDLVDYNITFVHIKGKPNILEDVISRCKMLNIYEELSENPKAQIVSNSQLSVMEICATSMHTIDINTLHNEQKWDKMCKS